TGASTSSAATFPLVNGYPNTNTGSNDAFLVRSRHVCSSGSCNYIDYGSFLGDTGNDFAKDVAVNSGNAYITGSTDSSFLGPTTMPGGTYGNAFVAKFNPNTTGAASLVYVTGFGSATSVDTGNAIAVSS